LVNNRLRRFSPGVESAIPRIQRSPGSDRCPWEAGAPFDSCA